jgi:hypothetical protein
MRIAEIDWPLFWHALSQLDPTEGDLWLARWVFADDGVRLSLRAAPPKTNDFGAGSETSESPAKIHPSELASTRLRVSPHRTPEGENHELPAMP